MEQQTPEWFMARVASLGGSKIAEALARKVRSGERMQSALDLQMELAAEELTGQPSKRVNALWWGKAHEDEARRSYAFLTNLEVVKVPILYHPTIAHAHASPDSLVGDEGGLEIKCPTSATHLRTLLAQAVPAEHMAQIYWNMACAGPSRKWWDFVSYDPRFINPAMRFFQKRVERDEAAITVLEQGAIEFLVEVGAINEQVWELYP